MRRNICRKIDPYFFAVDEHVRTPTATTRPKPVLPKEHIYSTLERFPITKQPVKRDKYKMCAGEMNFTTTCQSLRMLGLSESESRLEGGCSSDNPRDVGVERLRTLLPFFGPLLTDC
jgi:hypothetical protein